MLIHNTFVLVFAFSYYVHGMADSMSTYMYLYVFVCVYIDTHTHQIRQNMLSVSR